MDSRQGEKPEAGGRRDEGKSEGKDFSGLAPSGLLPRRDARRRLRRLYAGRGWTSVFCWLRYWHSNVPGIEARVPAEGTIVDLGCGHGVLANYLALRAPRRRVIGFDLSEHRIAVARSIGLPNAEFRCQNLFDAGGETRGEAARSRQSPVATKQEEVGSRQSAVGSPKSAIRNPKSEIRNLRRLLTADYLLKESPARAIIVADVLHHLGSLAEGDELLARCAGRLAPDGLLVVKDISKRPFWKYFCTRPVDFAFYKGKVFFRSPAQFDAMFERLGLEAELVRLDAWRPLPHVMYLCRRRGGRQAVVGA